MSHSVHPILSSDQLDQFNQEGYLILKNFYASDEVKQVCEGIYRVIGQVMHRHRIEDKRTLFSMDEFDAGFVDLIRRDRNLGSEIYDAVKFVPAFWRLVSDPQNAQLMSELRAGAFAALAASGCGIRIDNPQEDKFRTLWHQEYPAQLRSLDGLVFWSPLVPITPEIGPVSLCPRSHRMGPLPVKRLDEASSGRKGAYALELADETNIIAQYKPVNPLLQPTDLMVMDFLTLHASGYNVSRRSRWSMQFRYFNLNEPTGVRHGWAGSYAAGVDFARIHPELVV
jgi:hypothetical protein